VLLISITGEVEESFIKNNFILKTKTNTKNMANHHSSDGTKQTVHLSIQNGKNEGNFFPALMLIRMHICLYIWRS